MIQFHPIVTLLGKWQFLTPHKQRRSLKYRSELQLFIICTTCQAWCLCCGEWKCEGMKGVFDSVCVCVLLFFIGILHTESHGCRGSCSTSWLLSCRSHSRLLGQRFAGLLNPSLSMLFVFTMTRPLPLLCNSGLCYPGLCCTHRLPNTEEAHWSGRAPPSGCDGELQVD